MRGLLAACLLLACGFAQAQGVRIETLQQPAAGLSEKPLRVRVYLPADYDNGKTRYETLYVNDGQDMEAVGMQATLDDLYARKAIRPLIVVAIDMPSDRMAGYGFFDRTTGKAIVAPTKYGVVGANAQRYARWLVQELLPAVDARYRTRARAEGRAILGWSLGAASAFGIGWQYPETFARVGAFSPSFWLASDNTDAGAVQATRIAHALVGASKPARRPKLFFAVGTREETDDRDGDGVIDVLDDTRDLIEAVRRKSRGNATLHVLEAGRHEQQAWARMLPVFLRWAYATDAGPRAD